MNFIKSQWRQHRYKRYQKRSQRQIKFKNESPIRQFYSQATIDLNLPVSEVEFLALDMETTGLNPKKDRVLSIGYTVIKGLRIQVGASRHFYCQHTQTIPDESVIVHQITEQQAATGQPIEALFPDIVSALKGRVLLAHYADIELGFLNQTALELYDSPLIFPVVDTLRLAYRMTYKDSVHIERGALSLSQLRNKAGLPSFKAHNALTDAVATAELLLYQLKELNHQKPVPLKRIIL